MRNKRAQLETPTRTLSALFALYHAILFDSSFFLCQQALNHISSTVFTSGALIHNNKASSYDALDEQQIERDTRLDSNIKAATSGKKIKQKEER